MISALNHQQQLSGNSLLWCLIGFLYISCASTKLAPAKSNTQYVRANDHIQTKDSIPTQVAKQNTILSDTSKVKPHRASDTKVMVKVDTVLWKDISEENLPIVVKEKKKVNISDRIDIKETYKVKLLIPLNSDSYTDPNSSRFVHFYAGFLKALEVLDEEQIKLNIEVIDTEEGSYKVSENVSAILSENTDLIIGPFEKNDVKILAEACKNHEIPLVSPWQTSTKITNENPYYVQMKPNLKEHFVKITQFATSQYRKGEVAIVGRQNKDTGAWVKYFQDAAVESSGIKDFFSTYYVTMDSLNLGSTVFMKLFTDPKVKAVILPNYSYNEEDFVYACLRRMSAEKGSKHISVIGMPILYDSDKIDFDFYNALNMKLVISDFVDENHGKIREFRRSFLDMFGELPSADAVKGYDLTLYLGRNLWKYGKNFQNYLSQEATSYLMSAYDVQKTKTEDSQAKATGAEAAFDFFENKHLNIIEFSGNKWRIKE